MAKSMNLHLVRGIIGGHHKNADLWKDLASFKRLNKTSGEDMADPLS